MKSAKVDPILAKIMQAVSDELINDPDTIVFGGGRPDGRKCADAYDINCGYCEIWAENVRGVNKWWPKSDKKHTVEALTDDCLRFGGHVFIRFKGRFYDAECPQGVKSWKQLPLIKKYLKAERQARKAYGSARGIAV